MQADIETKQKELSMTQKEIDGLEMLKQLGDFKGWP